MLKTFFKSKSESNGNMTIPDEAYFSDLRKREYNRLSEANHIYLDYTGGNLYSKTQILKHQEMLDKGVFGNPHSTNPTSQEATRLNDEARQKVIDFFNAEDYYCIFTANASGALKIVGECYPFDDNGHYTLLADNHNSVNGIREYCKHRNGTHTYVPIQFEDLRIDAEKLEEALNDHSDKTHKLFAFPAQSNVSGVKHDLAWIKKAQDKGWDVLLDAAAYVPTTKLDLKQITPDFVSLSFYKIFGYPTGLGCLLVRKSKFELLKKRWFAGGTVTLASVLSPSHYLANNHERFENGTIDYLGIPAVKVGLDYIESIGIDRINKRVKALANYLYNRLRELKHSNGNPMVRMFGPGGERENTGGTLIMNFFNPDGSLIPFELIENRANERMISLRSGCFCNPGIDEVNNCLSTDELSNYFSSRDNGNYKDMIQFLNKMRGATRVSVGIATIQSDLDGFVDFVNSLKDEMISA